MKEDKAEASRAPKRLKTSHAELPTNLPVPAQKPLASLSRSITPPSRRNTHSRPQSSRSGDVESHGDVRQTSAIPSPVQLTHIRDIPDSSGYNKDTVKLRDILGDPLIKECWQFNFLIDVDFLMDNLDPDVKDLVLVKVVHGSWKREAPNRIRIEEACSRYQNVEQIIAYMPEPFGTHHSKMMILIRHDGFAQVVIHTANMIAQDWRNMSQAVWRSPLLPLQAENLRVNSQTDNRFGRGLRFKRDLLEYLAAYRKKKIDSLVNELKRYDFSAIRAALIASLPSRQDARSASSQNDTLWGWLALKDTIRNIPMRRDELGQNDKPHIVIQVSSIATLGQTDKWLKGTFFDSLCPRLGPNAIGEPRFSIVFPTPDEIRRSLDGYGSGGSIHMKIQSAAQQKQLVYLQPHLCHWAGDMDEQMHQKQTEGQTLCPDPATKPPTTREAGRKRAAPHIKTYVRFSDSNMESIDWAMVTSANLSTQAWGAATNNKGEVRICSWEVGVLIWPDLFVDDGNDRQLPAKEVKNSKGKKPDASERSRMVPCFGSDLPSNRETQNDEDSLVPQTTIGFRMPYNLPLRPYGARDAPWCTTASHSEPDWLGRTWEDA